MLGRIGAGLVLVALSGCVGAGDPAGAADASAPMTSVVGAPSAMQQNGMMTHSSGSGASMTSDMEQGGGMGQSGTSMGAGGIGSGIPQ